MDTPETRLNSVRTRAASKAATRRAKKLRAEAERLRAIAVTEAEELVAQEAAFAKLQAEMASPA